MKIKKLVELDIAVGLELEEWATDEDIDSLNEWLAENNLGQHIEVKSFYRAECFGDLDYPALQDHFDAPKGTVELCLLKWS